MTFQQVGNIAQGSFGHELLWVMTTFANGNPTEINAYCRCGWVFDTVKWPTESRAIHEAAFIDHLLELKADD